MAGRISELTDAAALTGAELLEVTQGGNSRKTTAAAIAALVANEQIDDRVAALLVAGSGVTITYDDGANTLTIAATGGGGSSTTVAVVNDTGTALTLATSHAGKMVRQSNASAITSTIPTNAADAIPVESVISLRQVGAGQITVTPAGGVTLNTPSGMQAKTRAQGSSVMLHKVGTNEWDLTGDLASV